MEAKRRIVITVDGLAGSGKTTLSKLLAQQLGFVQLNSGALYRGVGYIAVTHKIPLSDEKGIVDSLGKHSIELRLRDDRSTALIIDGIDMGDRVKTPEISEAASKVGSLPGVRAALVDAQRNAFPGENMVAEGRDMGTVIFPDADLKFYVEADEEVRIARRLGDFKSAGALNPNNSLKSQMEIEIRERDRRDSTRSSAPTKPASDAVIIDNSSQTLTQVLEKMYHAVALRGFSACK